MIQTFMNSKEINIYIYFMVLMYVQLTRHRLIEFHKNKEDNNDHHHNFLFVILAAMSLERDDVDRVVSTSWRKLVGNP